MTRNCAECQRSHGRAYAGPCVIDRSDCTKRQTTTARQPRTQERNTPMTDSSPTPGLTVKILPNDKSAPNGKLADAEILFTDGPLAGLRLLGFAIWEKRTGPGRNVTFPSRTYSVNGERRSFSLLRPNFGFDHGTGNAASDRARDLVLSAYSAHEQQAASDAPSIQTPAMLQSLNAPATAPATAERAEEARKAATTAARSYDLF